MPGPRLRFPSKMRLRLDRDFQRVYAGRRRAELGVVAVFALPNQLPHSRLGLSVPRKVGSAVRRNRIKRLWREAFRLGQRELPPGLDIVIAVRPHEPKPLADYRELLQGALRRLAQRPREAEPDPSRRRPTGDSA